MEIVMPKMGESVSEGTIIKWHKKVGDKVERDEIIFEISTDKVDTEIPSPAAGVIQEIKVPEGETVEVGTVVALINENGEAVSQTEVTPRIEKTQEKTEQRYERQPTIREEKVIEEPEVQTKSSQSTDGVIEIAMPKMGESVMEGTIIKWHKKVGDKVQKDETIFEISTDKVDTEIPSPVEGIITEILVAEQETVEVGTIVAKVSTSSSGAISKEKISVSESATDVIATSMKSDKQVGERWKFQLKCMKLFPLAKQIFQKVWQVRIAVFILPLF